MGTDMLNPLNYAVALGLGAVSWYVAFGLVQEGLKQVAEEQLKVIHAKQPVADVPDASPVALEAIPQPQNE